MKTFDKGSLRNCRQVCFFLLWILWGVYLFYLHQQVFLHFDDFGYGTLNYGWNGNQHGMQWDFRDLIGFLQWHYESWGGRILYFALLSVLLHAGEWLIQLIQPMILLGITVMIYQIVRRKKRDLFAAVLSMAVFGTIGQPAMTDGVLWYTAAAVYVWPILPLFFAVLLMSKPETEKEPWVKVILLSIVLFLAAFSHEQTAVMTLVMLAIFLVTRRLDGKKINLRWILPAVCAGAGALIEILAPGNFVRARADSAFYHLSLVEKIKYSFPRIIYRNIGSENLPFLLLLMITLSAAALWFSGMVRRQALRKILAGAVISAEAAAILSWIIPHNLVRGALEVYFLLVFCLVVCFLLFAKNRLLFSLFCGAICSQGMMVMSSAIYPRITLPFQLVCQLIACWVICRSVGNIHLLYSWGSFAAITCTAVVTLSFITAGYAGNADANRTNHRILQEEAAQIRSGETVTEIVLSRLPDDRFAVRMPYNGDYEKITSWAKAYYEIPQEVTILFAERK